MGFAMDYKSASDIMDEIASLTPIYGGISYERLEKQALQWPCRQYNDPGTSILHSEGFTRGKGKFIPVENMLPAETPDREYPFILTTGRILYQFHTRTMTGKAKGLNEIAPMNVVQMNKKDAEILKIKTGDKLKVRCYYFKLIYLFWY
jgi:predicted molibdopterin-dependent oxidoreductase YjgC